MRWGTQRTKGRGSEFLIKTRKKWINQRSKIVEMEVGTV